MSSARFDVNSLRRMQRNTGRVDNPYRLSSVDFVNQYSVRLQQNANTRKHLLSELRQEINSMDDDELTVDILVKLIKIGDFSLIKTVLDRKPAIVNEKIGDAYPIHFALYDNIDKDIVELLIEKGANLTLKDFQGDTPLMISLKSDDIELIKTLIKQDKNSETINLSNNEEETPLSRVLEFELELDIAKMLIEKGAHIDIASIFALLANSEIDFVLELIRDGKINVNGEVDSDGNRITDPILNQFCNYNFFETEILGCIGFEFCKKFIEGLIEKGCDMEAQSNGGYTPLHLAVANGTLTGDELYEVVKILIEEGGADVNAKDKNGITVLQSALERGCSTNLYELLIKKGANIDALDNDGYDAFHYAAVGGVTDFIVKNFGQRDINHQYKNGETLLHAYLYSEKANAVALKDLLKFEPNLYIEDSKGLTPFHIAVDRSLDKALLTSLFDNSKLYQGEKNILHIAAEFGSFESFKDVTELFLGRNYNLYYNRYCDELQEDFIKLLNAQDDKGNTPLHYAVMGFEKAEEDENSYRKEQSYKIVSYISRYLNRANKSDDIANTEGKTPYQLIGEDENHFLSRFFKEKNKSYDRSDTYSVAVHKKTDSFPPFSISPDWRELRTKVSKSLTRLSSSANPALSAATDGEAEQAPSAAAGSAPLPHEGFPEGLGVSWGKRAATEGQHRAETPPFAGILDYDYQRKRGEELGRPNFNIGHFGYSGQQHSEPFPQSEVAAADGEAEQALSAAAGSHVGGLGKRAREEEEVESEGPPLKKARPEEAGSFQDMLQQEGKGNRER
ncbi:ankyrin repeat domain-containing protein [Rickettsiales bacterium]|nr:ankyrin repeat domain-containing protein [Rickettsiales bacterium]